MYTISFSYFSFQKTYAQVPAYDESHLNFMNTLDCKLSVKINSTDFYQTADLNPNSNLVLYNLRSNQEHMLTVQLQNKTCVIDAKENLEQILIFNATGEKAIFFTY